MLVPMTRIQIIGAKSDLPQTISTLQQLGAVQLDSWRESQAFFQRRMTYDEATLRRRERLAYQAAQVEAVLAILPCSQALPSFETKEVDVQKLLDTVEAALTQLKPQVQTLITRRDQLEDQLNALPRYEATLRQLLPLLPSTLELEHYAVTTIWLERRYQAALETIRQALETLSEGRCEIISREVGPDTLAAVLIFPKAQAGAVNKLLGQENISQVRLPAEFTGQPLAQALTNIQQRLRDIPGQLREIEVQRQSLAQNWCLSLLEWQALLRDHLAQIEVCVNFGQTDYTFVIEGWIPKNRLAEVETALAHEVGETVVVIEMPLRPAEQAQAPVAFANPRFVQPFESLVGLLALPKAGGFDPTPLMALFMPIFFGLILGDIAYGTILLGLMLYLRRRFKTQPMMASLAEVLIIGSAWSIIFGVLFGEFFGTLGESFGIRPLWFDRGHNVQALLLLTISIGAGHVVLGLCLGIWQAIQQHSRHDLVEKGAMLLSLIALFGLVAVLTGYLPDSFFTPAIALLVVGLVILSYSLGSLGLLLGPLELLGTIGNILSYLRIAAIGLSSVYLAQVANELAGIFGNVLLGLIIAALFHTLNIALGAFSPTIQSLRLHYVEFFGKFYQSGGEPFRPFQRSGVIK